MAENMTDSIARENMLEVAAAYDRMAHRIEADPKIESRVGKA
jgi:hypothetical protein